MSLTLTPRIGSSERGPFPQAHRKPALIISFTSRRYCMPFVMLTKIFLCSSIDHTFLASSVGHLASERKTVPILFRPNSSARSPFSIMSMTFSSSGSTCIQNRLCLLGLFAIASKPCPVTPSLYTTIGREVIISNFGA